MTYPADTVETITITRPDCHDQHGDACNGEITLPLTLNLNCPGEYRIVVDHAQCPEPMAGMSPVAQHFTNDNGHLFNLAENSAQQLMLVGSHSGEEAHPYDDQGWLIKFSRDYGQAKEMLIKGISPLAGCAALSHDRNVIAGRYMLALIDNDLNVVKSVSLSQVGYIKHVVTLNNEIYCQAEYGSTHLILRLDAQLNVITGIDIGRVAPGHLWVTPDQRLLTIRTDGVNGALVRLTPELTVERTQRLPSWATTHAAQASNGDIYTLNNAHILRFDKELNLQAGVSLLSGTPMGMAADATGVTLQINASGHSQLYRVPLDHNLQPQQLSRITHLPDGPVVEHPVAMHRLSNGDLITAGLLNAGPAPLALVNNRSLIDSADNWQFTPVTEQPFIFTNYSYPADPISVSVTPYAFTASESTLEVSYR